MHRQRKAVFFDRLRWNLTVTGGLEIDAYDGPDAVYLLSMEADRLMSSARLLPTTRPHLMSDLFQALCPDGVPHGPAVWEVSRFCIAPAIRDRQARHGQLWQIIAGILEAGLALGVERATFVAGSALLPLTLDAGWDAGTLGPTLSDGRDAITAVIVRVTADGLEAVRARHGIMGRVCAPTAGRAAA